MAGTPDVPTGNVKPNDKPPETIEEIMRRVGATRAGFVLRVKKACQETANFGEGVSWVIGEISLDEAETAVRDFFIEKLRTGL